jgi:hypothetical protein
MRSLLTLTFLPFLSQAGYLAAPAGGANAPAGGANWSPSGGEPLTDHGATINGGAWTGAPKGIPTNLPGGIGGPNGSPSATPAAPAASPAPAAPAAASSPAGAPAPAPAASSAAPAVPIPAAPSIAPAAASPGAAIPASPAAVTSAAIPIPAAASSAAGPVLTGQPVSHGMPSPGDMIPAAQCPVGGTPGGQWTPFLVAHQGSDQALQCPTNDSTNIHWFLDSDQIGCCPQNAYLTTAVPGQYACCPCGSSCGGLPPAAFQDWTMSGSSFTRIPTSYAN